jgi:ubiquitin conjugation factor E4 B
LFLEDLVSELVEEKSALDMSSSNWERILYSRLSLPANSEPSWPCLFDYLVQAFIKAQVRKSNLQKLQEADANLNSIVNRRLAKILEMQSLLLNYSGLILNPDTVDMFPTNHSYFSFNIDMVLGFGVHVCLRHLILKLNIHVSLLKRLLNGSWMKGWKL